jgi:hypothetical protein
MAVIIKNNGDDPWLLADTSPKITIASSDQLDLEIHLSLAAIAASDQLLADIGNSSLSLTVNDGSKDLTLDEAIRHILQRPAPGPCTSAGTPLYKEMPYTISFSKFVRVSDGVEQMAVDGTSTIAESVWDGTGGGDTGSDWTRGGVGSETTSAAHAGDNGLDTGVTSEDDTWWFDYGSNRDLENIPYDSINFWMNCQAYPEKSVLRCGWAVSGSTTFVSNELKISNYIPNFDLDTWQYVSIPLSDFNLNQSVGRFIFTATKKDGQQFYFDDITLSNSGSDGPYRYRVTGATDEQHHVSRIVLVVVSGDSNWNSTAFADISGGLPSGLILRQCKLSTQEIVWATTMKNNMDLFGQMMPAEPVNFADNELMMVFNIKPEKTAIILTNDDALEFVVRDDLSSLTNMRAYLQYGVEELTS